MRQSLFGLFVFLLILGIVPTIAQTIDFPSITATTLRYDPFPAQPGEYMHLWINLENKGTKDAENLLIVLEPIYPFSLDSNENATREIIYLRGLDSTIIDYKIRVASNAVEGENELKIKYSTKGGDVWTEKELNINVQTLDANLAITNVESKEVSPGETTNIKISLRNEADSYLSDIRVKLNVSDSFLPINSTAEKRIYLIESKEEKILEFNLLVAPDITCGPYRIPITLTYYDSTGEKYVETDYITSIVSAEPEISVSLEESEILTSGQVGEITINIVNKGLTSIKYLTINLKHGDYEILSLSEIYIGNLDTDDYDTTEFRIYTESNEKELPLKIGLSYMDDNNKEYSEERTVGLRLYNIEELQKYNLIPAQSNIPLIILVIVVLLIAYWLYRKMKRK